MIAVFRRFQHAILTSTANLSEIIPSVLTQRRNVMSTNVVFRVSSGHVLLNGISFQHSSMGISKTFSTSGSISTSDKIDDKIEGIIRKAADASKTAVSEDVKDLFKEIEEAAYKLLYVEQLKPEEMATLAALWNQATKGPCNENQPEPDAGFQELARWKMWKSFGNMTKVEAAKEYLKIAKKYF